MRRPLSAVLALAFLALPTGHGAPEGKTVIESDRLEVIGADDGNTFVFSGAVRIAGEDFTATCDRMEVRTVAVAEGDSADAAGFGAISVVEATGSVRIVQGDREATAGRALIFPAENRVVLEDNPVVRDAGGVVRGHRMILFGEDRRITVEPGPAGERPSVELPSLENLDRPETGGDE